MTIALIFAGGTGQRMNTNTRPKQFLELHGKPILIYTIEHFEYHPEIDAVVVVCLDDWIDVLRKELRRFAITKVRAVVPGGATGQQSIFNGLRAIEGADDKTLVVIHDGVRPLINEQLITDTLACAREKGNAVTVAFAQETVALVGGADELGSLVERRAARIIKAPQAFFYPDIIAVHRRAEADGLSHFVDSATLMMHYGQALHTVRCRSDNIKITTASDYYIFRALYEARENTQILGY